mmetsp:Transcript_68172/g.160343  ORF Transcript_68172/g.160343 Transcript_68172/m.160343 type:complete len:96 (+) Transcript_68172:2-289(+)
MFQKLLARVEALIEESMRLGHLAGTATSSAACRSRKGLDWGTWKSQICSMMVTESEQAIREMMEEIEFLMAHNSQLGATADEAVHAHNAHAVAMG